MSSASLKSSLSSTHIATRRAIPRREFLRGAGVLLSLPLLDSMLPAFARGASSAPATDAATKPRRMFAVCNNLGLLPDQFFPTEANRGYALSPYLSHLAAHREDFTVFSGVSHPDCDVGHPSDICFLTAAPHPGSSGFRNTLSLDQLIAERLGQHTRFGALALSVNVNQSARSLSWTRSGVMIPAEESASAVFKLLFVQGTPAEVDAQLRRLAQGRSILDVVGRQAKKLERTVGARDRERLDQYFTSVRDLELQIDTAKEWEKRPKPVVAAPMPVDPVSPRDYMAKIKLMYDLARLAFETDSTRAITLMLDSAASPAIDLDHEVKITEGYHNLSHHGRSEEKLKQLQAIDVGHMKLLAKLFADLKSVREEGATLFERTMVLYGTNMGNASSHVTTNLPTLLAGGGFRHGQHLVFDRGRNTPLPNLYVSMLRRMGIDADKFASSTGPIRGLDFAG